MVYGEVSNEMDLLLYPSDTCVTLYMLESILTTLRMEQKALQEPWDHAIELTPGSQPFGTKVYPMYLNEE